MIYSKGYRGFKSFRRLREVSNRPSSSNRENDLQHNTNHRERQVNRTMNKLINNIKTSYNHLSMKLIEDIDKRQYQRFFKGRLEDREAQVSLATACFHIGQGFGYLSARITVINITLTVWRKAILNRLK